MSEPTNGISIPGNENKPQSWWGAMTGYHWIVMILCSLGWALDCFNQQLFAVNRAPAVAELMQLSEGAPEVGYYSGWATALMLIGWATGGIFFGIWADKYGRVRIMIISLFFFTIFTGLTGTVHSLSLFLLYRFLSGLGAGGQFAVCATLIAETLSNRTRPIASGLMQAAAAAANICAALSMFAIVYFVSTGTLSNSPWRYAFLLGYLPLILAIFNWGWLKEPEAWKKAKEEEKTSGRKTGSLLELFGERTLRYRVIMGMLLATIGIIGYWGIMMFAVDLNRSIFRTSALKEIGVEVQNTAPAKIASIIAEQPKEKQEFIRKKVEKMGALTSIMINVGSFFGMYLFAVVIDIFGRRWTFTFFQALAIVSVLLVFLKTSNITELFLYSPLMGFAIGSLLTGYTIYFPELFPTRLRSTAVSFCYNAGRYLSAGGAAIFGLLTSVVFADTMEPFRWAGAVMSPIFLIGILIIWLMPETKGKPLPE
ncbi:MAG: MFS transporter [Planctomycetia bacterium]|nr:MFS transporter [Planctomycetia bacterium]